VPVFWIQAPHREARPYSCSNAASRERSRSSRPHTARRQSRLDHLATSYQHGFSLTPPTACAVRDPPPRLPGQSSVAGEELFYGSQERGGFSGRTVTELHVPALIPLAMTVRGSSSRCPPVERTLAPQPCQEIPVEQMSGGVLARIRPDLGIGVALGRRRQRGGSGSPRAWPALAAWGDNAGMARHDGRAAVKRAVFMLLLDGTRPSGVLEWVSPFAPAVTQAAAGAGHWAARRRRRALAWASAAGFGLVAWGLGTEAPSRAEAESISRQQGDLPRRPGTTAPATAGTQPPAARQLSRWALHAAAFKVAGMPLAVRSGLRHPRRLTVLAVVGQAPTAVFYVLRVPRAVQRRRPRIAVGSALVAAGAIARLRAASAEPLQQQQPRRRPSRQGPSRSNQRSRQRESSLRIERSRLAHDDTRAQPARNTASAD
jgi:hypothetical protein